MWRLDGLICVRGEVGVRNMEYGERGQYVYCPGENSFMGGSLASSISYRASSDFTSGIVS
jgi:hypothetical protein